ncbi:MAG: uroporphyrinogen-III C-methyltransferase [Actinomycetota bacterium]|nr:uroporphyrinogen-III C-methyltransferase [Actinomycetota bacterium]
MTVHLVGAGPGDPRLITVRGAELLAQADVVVHDRLVDPALLELVRPEALLVDVGKGAGLARQQRDINALLVEHGRRSATVVRLKGGDPFVFGRGGEEIEALLAAGVPVEVVPGVSSAVAVPAAAGVPVTHRGLSASVTIVTGHAGPGAGGGGGGVVDWASLAAGGGTLVVLMGVDTRAAIARSLLDGGRDPATPVAVVRWGTTGRQHTVRTTLAGLGAVEATAPSTIVVGAVAGLELGTIEDRPLHGMTVVVTRSRSASAALRGALVDAGANVVQLPVTAVADPSDGGAALHRAVAGIGRYRWVLFTSATAVDRVLGIVRDGRDLAGVGIAAVGPATAAALAEHRMVADVVPADDASGAGLAAAMPTPAGDGGSGRVLYPRAADARRALPDGLAAKGWVVDEVEAYRTVPVPSQDLPAPALAAARGATAIVVAAPSAVAAAAAAIGLPCPPAVCIGPTTADAARSAGMVVAAVAARPTPDEIVRALSEWWEVHRPGRAP